MKPVNKKITPPPAPKASNVNSKNLFVVEMNNYLKPNPMHLLRQTQRYITNDTDNGYFYFVEDRYVGSATNAAIIDSYSNYIYGEGIQAVGVENFNQILKKEDMRLIVKDLKMHGAFAMQIVYSKDRKTITNIYHLPTKTIAYNKQDDITEAPESFWYCFDWRDKAKFRPVIIPAFGKGEKEDPTEIYYARIPSTQPLFSLPDYQSGLQYCQLEEELSNYYINHVKNNFSAGKIINVNQGSTGEDEAKEEAKRTLKAELTGTSNAGNIVVSFNDNKDNATTVDSIEITNAYEQFQWLSEEARDKILMAHKVVNPILFGIKGGEGFSNNADEMIVALKTLYRSQINPLREIIIDALEDIYNQMGVIATFRFKDFEELRVKEEQANKENVTSQNGQLKPITNEN